MTTKERETGVLEITIPPEDIAAYHRDGAVCLRGVFSPEWVERTRDAVERLLVANRKGASQELDLITGAYEKDEGIREFIHHSPAADIARALMKSLTSRFFFAQVFVKEPGVAAPTPWHHDQTYWPVRGEQVCSLWLALDPVTKESSGLEYVKGSHLWDKRYKPEGFNAETTQTFAAAAGDIIPDFDQRRDEFEFLSWDMQPGDVLAHAGFAIHGAGGNRTQNMRRRALSTRWLGDDARYAPELAPTSRYLDPELQPDGPFNSPRFPLIVG